MYSFYLIYNSSCYNLNYLGLTDFTDLIINTRPFVSFLQLPHFHFYTGYTARLDCI